MQSRDICVKCLADGELLPERKVENCLRYVSRTRCSRSSGIPFEMQVLICLPDSQRFFCSPGQNKETRWI